jgi:hypothetical protein
MCLGARKRAAVIHIIFSYLLTPYWIYFHKSYMCVFQYLITNSVMQVILFSILFNYLISKFHSLRKPKIKFRVQKAGRWSVPEIC